MNRYSKYFRIFFAPNNGGGSGASSASGASSGAAGAEATKDDPWSKIDLDNLDDTSRAALTALKDQFATLQTDREQKDALVREFQSKADKTAAELHRMKASLSTAITGEDPTKSAPQGPAPEYIAEIERTMVESGVNAAAAKAQAPVMAKMLHAQEQQIMARMGAGIAPVANMVMLNEATQAFQFAKATDTTGVLSIPDVAQQVWNTATELAREGKQVTVETINNLKGMHFMAHAEKNPSVFATLQMNGGVPPLPPTGRPAISVTTGGYSYPGATFAPALHQPPDPNAPRTTLDPGTKSALQSIFSNLKPGHVVK